MRETLDLDPNARFAGIPKDKESKLDVAARTGGAAYGTKTLKDALGEAPWQSLLKTPEKLDRIAEVLTFREDLDSICKGLDEIGLDGMIVQCLLAAATKGEFKDFTRAAHISALACRNIIPGLREGLVYSDACARVGYDHAARPSVQLTAIGSPVTRKAFGEAIKQIRAVAREYGPIDLVHIELARDVGKSADERREIQDGIEKRTAEKERRRGEAAEHLGRAPSDDELLRYELAKEQNFKCVYSGDAIEPKGVAANDTRYQVDHILPWSRFGDDFYINKTLCTTEANQNKRGRTPFEWFDAEKTEPEWMEYVARVEALKEVKGRKKRNYTLKDAAAVEEKFKARNLTDTQWATRLLADELTRMFPAPEGERRVFTRPGAITSKLRRAWGLEGLKKVDGERVPDDRHHAIDALVLAATTDSLLIKMTKDVQQREKQGRQHDIFHVQQPWPGFRIDVTRAVYGENEAGGVFVSRAERRRARGKAHDATIRQVRDIDGEKIVFERKAIEKLTERDLEKIPVPAPYGKIADPKKLRDDMVEALRQWIAAGKPKDKLPRSPKGDFIRKVRVETKDKVAVELSGGTVDRGDMARVDVFRKKNKKGKWEFYVVPVYPHQIADEEAWPNPPTQAVQAHIDESEWPSIDSTFEFTFSLNPMCYLELVTSKGKIIEGYYREMNRNDAGITLSAHLSNDARSPKTGSRTLQDFRKFTIDRLGRKFEVSRARCGHGVERRALNSAGTTVARRRAVLRKAGRQGGGQGLYRGPGLDRPRYAARHANQHADLRLHGSRRCDGNNTTTAYPLGAHSAVSPPPPAGRGGEAPARREGQRQEALVAGAGARQDFQSGGGAGSAEPTAMRPRSRRSPAMWSQTIPTMWKRARRDFTGGGCSTISSATTPTIAATSS